MVDYLVEIYNVLFVDSDHHQGFLAKDHPNLPKVEDIGPITPRLTSI